MLTILWILTYNMYTYCNALARACFYFYTFGPRPTGSHNIIFESVHRFCSYVYELMLYYNTIKTSNRYPFYPYFLIFLKYIMHIRPFIIYSKVYSHFCIVIISQCRYTRTLHTHAHVVPSRRWVGVLWR